MIYYFVYIWQLFFCAYKYLRLKHYKCMKIQAIIMAGGVGSRLRPLTDDTPKPMVKIIDKPVLETIIERLKYFGIYDIGLTVNYKSDVIKNYFSNGRRFGVRLTYFEEEKPLGTAGSVKQAEKYLSDNFFVASGDAYSEVDYDRCTKRTSGKIFWARSL